MLKYALFFDLPMPLLVPISFTWEWSFAQFFIVLKMEITHKSHVYVYTYASKFILVAKKVKLRLIHIAYFHWFNTYVSLFLGRLCRWVSQCNWREKLGRIHIRSSDCGRRGGEQRQHFTSSSTFMFEGVGLEYTR